MLCLGALASALPTRAQRAWTGATLVSACELLSRLYAAVETVAASLSRLSKITGKTSEDALADLARAGCPPPPGRVVDSLAYFSKSRLNLGYIT